MLKECEVGQQHRIASRLGNGRGDGIAVAHNPLKYGASLKGPG